MSFAVQKLLSFIRFHLFIFVFISISLGGGSKRILLLFMSQSVLPIFCSKSLIVSGLTFRSLINFEFIFVYDVREWSNFILLHVPAALFTIARTWKQPKCPSSDEWIKKMWHICTMKYYSAIKRNEIELFVVRWMDLESVIQSEVSQKEKNKYSMLTHIYG